MKKCVPPKSGRLISAFAVLFCAAAAVFPFRALKDGGQSPVACIAIGVFLAGLSVYLLWRMLSKGVWGFFYNEETILFVLSRKDRREFRWEEIPASKVVFSYPAQASAPGWFFFPDGKKIAVLPRMAGYESFIATLRKKGFPAARSFEAGNVKEIFQAMFGEQFGGDDRS